MLTEIGADEVPVELVLNKIDLVDPLRRRRLANMFPGSLQIAAATGAGVDDLRERIAQRFSDRYVDVRMLLPYEDGGTLAVLKTPKAEEAIEWVAASGFWQSDGLTARPWLYVL